FGTFARAVIDRKPDDKSLPRFLGDGTQLDRFKEVVSERRPAWHYAVMCALAVAATVTLAPGTAGFSHDFSLLNRESWGAPWRLPAHWPERLFYPAILFTWLLSFMIGLPDLLVHLFRHAGLGAIYLRRLLAFLIPWIAILVVVSVAVADSEWVAR